MPTATTVVTVRQRLVTLIAAATGVQTSYSWPGEVHQEPESIWMGFATSEQSVPTMKAGRKSRDEEYVQEIVVEVYGDGDNQETTDTRCAELVGEVDDVFADDPNLGIPATILWATVTGWEQVSGSTDRGHACRFVMSVSVRARLT